MSDTWKNTKNRQKCDKSQLQKRHVNNSCFINKTFKWSTHPFTITLQIISTVVKICNYYFELPKSSFVVYKEK